MEDHASIEQTVGNCREMWSGRVTDEIHSVSACSHNQNCVVAIGRGVSFASSEVVYVVRLGTQLGSNVCQTVANWVTVGDQTMLSAFS
jgi:hypothetical protein